MRPPDLVYRASRLRATGRLFVAHHLQRAWWWYMRRCRNVEAFGFGLAGRYRELWQQGWRWWLPALLLAPLVAIAALAVATVAALGRGIGALGAGLVLVFIAATLVAPVLGVVLAVMSFTGKDSGPEPARAAAACDPSYPEFCVAEGLGDLDCPLGGGGAPYAPASNLIVRGPDVHELDGDGDGIGCESSMPDRR